MVVSFYNYLKLILKISTKYLMIKIIKHTYVQQKLLVSFAKIIIMRIFTFTLFIRKIDGVCLVDYRPSADILHHFV